MTNNTAEIYATGNPWQRKVYRKMSDYLAGFPEVKTYGKSKKGNPYKHLLSIEQKQLNFIFPEIYLATLERFNKQKAGDLNRVLTNTAASQAYCFNLIIFLQQDIPLANKLFSNLLGKSVKIIHLEPEFTPDQDENIGDQSMYAGTDADTAVFYTYEAGKKGVLLIEFKFIEHEFSVCTSYAHKKNIREICNSETYYENLILNKLSNFHACGYTKYRNWQLTSQSEVFDLNKITSASCPFRFGLNQLWRNYLLAEQVSRARACNEFGFWVFSPKENDDYLWKKGKTEEQFRSILTDKGNLHFKKIWLDSVFDILQNSVSTSREKEWLFAMEKKYKI